MSGEFWYADTKSFSPIGVGAGGQQEPYLVNAANALTYGYVTGKPNDDSTLIMALSLNFLPG